MWTVIAKIFSPAAMFSHWLATPYGHGEPWSRPWWWAFVLDCSLSSLCSLWNQTLKWLSVYAAGVLCSPRHKSLLMYLLSISHTLLVSERFLCGLAGSDYICRHLVLVCSQLPVQVFIISFHCQMEAKVSISGVISVIRLYCNMILLIKCC